MLMSIDCFENTTWKLSVGEIDFSRGGPWTDVVEIFPSIARTLTFPDDR